MCVCVLEPPGRDSTAKLCHVVDWESINARPYPHRAINDLIKNMTRWGNEKSKCSRKTCGSFMFIQLCMCMEATVSQSSRLYISFKWEISFLLNINTSSRIFIWFYERLEPSRVTLITTLYNSQRFMWLLLSLRLLERCAQTLFLMKLQKHRPKEQ